MLKTYDRQKNGIIELGTIDKAKYSCIAKNIATNKVIITEKQLDHIAEKHPEAYDKVLIELKETLRYPDYIFKDSRHSDTGLVTKSIFAEEGNSLFIVLKVCTDNTGDSIANSVISGWTISEKRLRNYIKNKVILYKK